MYNSENLPQVIFSDDPYIAKHQSDIMVHGIQARVEMQKVSTYEKIQNQEEVTYRLNALYVFLTAVTSLFLLFSFFTSETYLELAREKKVSKVEKLKAKKLLLEKEISNLEE